MKCRACRGALILNATAFQQHQASKRHAKQLARRDEQEQQRLAGLRGREHGGGDGLAAGLAAEVA